MTPNRGHERGNSNLMEQRKMDTTIMSDIDYINIFPDLENQDIDDSSFLKGSLFEKGSSPKKTHRRVESLDASKFDERI